jgi:hypothetical protein
MFRLVLKRVKIGAIWPARGTAVKCVLAAVAAFFGWLTYYAFAHVGC